MDKCPYCGGESYSTKDYAYGACTRYYNFDGSEADNSEYHEGMKYRIGKIAYCADCNKSLGKLKDVEK